MCVFNHIIIELFAPGTLLKTFLRDFSIVYGEITELNNTMNRGMIRMYNVKLYRKLKHLKAKRIKMCKSIRRYKMRDRFNRILLDANSLLEHYNLSTFCNVRNSVKHISYRIKNNVVNNVFNYIEYISAHLQTLKHGCVITSMPVSEDITQKTDSTLKSLAALLSNGHNTSINIAIKCLFGFSIIINCSAINKAKHKYLKLERT